MQWMRSVCISYPVEVEVEQWGTDMAFQKLKSLVSRHIPDAGICLENNAVGTAMIYVDLVDFRLQDQKKNTGMIELYIRLKSHALPFLYF